MLRGALIEQDKERPSERVIEGGDGREEVRE